MAAQGHSTEQLFSSCFWLEGRSGEIADEYAHKIGPGLLEFSSASAHQQYSSVGVLYDLLCHNTSPNDLQPTSRGPDR